MLYLVIVLSLWIAIYLIAVTDLRRLSKEVKDDLTDEINNFDITLKNRGITFSVKKFADAFFGASFEFYVEFATRCFQHMSARLIARNEYFILLKVELRSSFITILEEVVNNLEAEAIAQEQENERRNAM